MFLDKHQKIHLIGIGGIGVSAVAKLLKLTGRQVSGSDIGESETIEELKALGIKVYKGQAAKNIEDDIDLIVYTSAAPEDNPERVEGKKRGIKELSYFEFLGAYSKDKWTVAVSGTHGKSTTTAMLGLMAAEAGLDPTVIVGSKVKNFQYGNLRIGDAKRPQSHAQRDGSDLFIVEACEHLANMLHINPRMIVLTNIEADHLDYYKNLDNIMAAFRKYVQKLPADGKLIFNADDENVCEIIKSFNGEKLGFGLKKSPSPPFPKGEAIESTKIHSASSPFIKGRDREGFFENTFLLAEEIRIDDGFQKYHFAGHDYILRVPGMYNAYNAFAASTAALALGVEPEVIKKTLEHFKGIWRRFEVIGEHDGALIISDYGHHPTAVRETIAGIRGFYPVRGHVSNGVSAGEISNGVYPGRRLVLAFQPHHRNRTKNLFNEFIECFDGLDVLVLTEIFDVAGREGDADADISSKDLIEPIKARGKVGEVYFAATPKAAEEKLLQIIRSGDIIIVMGAGDIYKICNALVK
ncbi:MAG: Mur ligase family protein [Patescibacteria group bacterium]